MLNLYEEYASQEERESAVMLENAEIAMDRALLSLNTCCAMQELDMRAAESRLVLECGGVENLMDYYEEAAENTADKKEGLFARVWDSILKFLGKIKEALFGKKDCPTDPNKEAQVPKTWLEKHEKINAALNAVKAAFQRPGVKAIVAAIGAITAIFAVKKGGPLVKVKVGDLWKRFKKEEQIVNELESGVNAVKDKKSEDESKTKDFQSWVSKYTKSIRESANDMWGAIKGAASDVKEKITGIPSKVKAEIKREALKAAANAEIQKELDYAFARLFAGNQTSADIALIKRHLGSKGWDELTHYMESADDDLFSNDDDLFTESAEVDEIAALLATL